MISNCEPGVVKSRMSSLQKLNKSYLLPLPPTLETPTAQYQTRGTAPRPHLPCLHRIACPENGDTWWGTPSAGGGSRRRRLSSCSCRGQRVSVRVGRPRRRRLGGSRSRAWRGGRGARGGTVLAQQPLQVGVPLTGSREAVPLVEWNADHPPASRCEEAPLEQRRPIGFAHAPSVGQQEVRGAVHLDRDA